MREFLVYLAGPISGTAYGEAVDWREDARRRFAPNIEGVSPMRGKEYLRGEDSIADSYSQYILSTGRAIMTRDMNDVRRADMVLANLLGATKVSIGTVLELGAAYALNIPVVLCIEPYNIHQHAMLLETAGWVVESLDAGIGVVNAVLGIRPVPRQQQPGDLSAAIEYLKGLSAPPFGGIAFTLPGEA